ncbi:hypothetical protein [Lacrimispora sp. 210928-DFI.3.58]|uniref:hypothetical protein n=1 Tax=Lacrimispora sp. 210928-DFI.3.58 TaxID=2883214 RepID=UPI001D09799E|nr:hypothetical protein [Lacrimispora sp. 210928-DFI.3.58]MCB7319900.1 hypothetical protein [Lacrimispora sp. 210928-DFI.3.58]
MAAYTAKDIRNLKKMIRFVENHNASIEEEELKKELFELDFGVLAEEEDMLYALFTPFPKFCEEWRSEESEKNAKMGAIKDSYRGQDIDELEKERVRAINRIKENHGDPAAQFEIIEQIYEQLDEAATVISRNRIVRGEMKAYMRLCFLDRLLKDNVPFMKILQYLDRNDMDDIRDTYRAALRLKEDLTLTDEETALIERVKAEWEEKTVFDWEGNVIMGKVMKKFAEYDNDNETE